MTYKHVFTAAAVALAVASTAVAAACEQLTAAQFNAAEHTHTFLASAATQKLGIADAAALLGTTPATWRVQNDLAWAACEKLAEPAPLPAQAAALCQQVRDSHDFDAAARVSAKLLLAEMLIAQEAGYPTPLAVAVVLHKQKDGSFIDASPAQLQAIYAELQAAAEAGDSEPAWLHNKLDAAKTRNWLLQKVPALQPVAAEDATALLD